MNAQLDKIINTPLPAMVANIRDLTPKEHAAAFRNLFKSLGLSGISVTVHNYRVNVNLPRQNNDEHEPIHMELEAKERARNAPYMGMSKICPFCGQSNDAFLHMQKIIQAAFPDSGDRSDLLSDYFDFIYTVNC